METVEATHVASKTAAAVDLANLVVSYGDFSLAASGNGVWAAGLSIFALIAWLVRGWRG